MIELTLTWPPSANHYFRHLNAGKLAGRTLISRAGREYRRYVAQERLRQLRLHETPLPGRLAVTVEAYPPDARRRDLDNILKALLDALEYGGVIVNDSQVDFLQVERKAERLGLVKVKVAQL